jgi:hypothetical protein
VSQKKIATAFAMALAGIYAYPAAHPDFAGLRNCAFGLLSDVIELSLKFIGLP